MTGWTAAVVVGASGPALLRRFGTARSPVAVQPAEEEPPSTEAEKEPSRTERGGA